MDISKQCCSLDQAKMLKRLGVVQLTMHYWYCGFKNDNHGLMHIDWYSDKNQGCMTNASYAAFTVAELGVMLPSDCKTQKVSNVWSASYHALNNKSFYESGIETEAEARAILLLYLLEEKLITPEEVNTRLTTH